MPDPGRLVRQSVAIMQRLGLSEADALASVLVIAAQVRLAAISAGHADLQWVDDILRSAGGWLARFTPSYTETGASENADG